MVKAVALVNFFCALVYSVVFKDIAFPGSLSCAIPCGRKKASGSISGQVEQVGGEARVTEWQKPFEVQGKDQEGGKNKGRREPVYPHRFGKELQQQAAEQQYQRHTEQVVQVTAEKNGGAKIANIQLVQQEYPAEAGQQAQVRSAENGAHHQDTTDVMNQTMAAMMPTKIT